MHRIFFASSTLCASLLLPGLAAGVPLTIVPPDELTLNGAEIFEGTFNLTGVIGYSDGTGSAAGTIAETTFLDPTDGADDVSKRAVIGNTAVKDLGIDIPVEIEVLKLTGFFEPSMPTVTPSAAAFEIFVGVLTLDNASPPPLVVDNFTYYLPLETSELFPQITDLGMDADRASLGDNTDTFFAAGTSFSVTNTIPSAGVKLDNGVDNPWWIVPDGSPPPTLVFAPPPPGSTMPNCPDPTIVTVQRHGSTTTRVIPGPCDPPPTGVPAPAPGLLLAPGLVLALCCIGRRRGIAPAN